MISEKQHEAIAEADGWFDLERIKYHGEILLGINLDEYLYPRDFPTPLDIWKAKVPDYLTDRSAMIKAIERLSLSQLGKFARILQEITCNHCVGVIGEYYRDLQCLGKLLISKNESLAEAYLRTVGKWEE